LRKQIFKRAQARAMTLGEGAQRIAQIDAAHSADAVRHARRVHDILACY
jgi:hypothetical protein